MILPINWNDLFSCWKYYYQGSLFQKPDLTRAWFSLPKYICLKIWAARNKDIFEGEVSSPRKVMSSAKSLWVEALLTRGMIHIHKEPLNSEERAWTIDFLSHVTNNWHMAIQRPNCLKWQLRMSYEDFAKWRFNLGCNSLFFGGASKGNPILPGVGGVIFYSEGKI